MHILCETCVLLALGLILSGLRALKWRPSTLILEKSHSKWRVQLSSIPISILSFISCSISPLLNFSLCLCSYFPPFSIRSLSSYYVSFHALSIPHHTSSSPYNAFFLFFPLKVNLHTYLTTWLSSCPVGIFPRSHHLIVKISILK